MGQGRDEMKALTMKDDGVNAVDLGVVGPWQYALSFVGPVTAAEVWRRAAGDVGTYGGWRWEMPSTLPGRYPAMYGDLGARIEAAIAARRMAAA